MKTKIGRNENTLRNAVIRFIFILLTFFHLCGYSTASTDSELFDLGVKYYEAHDFFKAAMYLFAYIERNPPAIHDDKEHKDSVLNALIFCEQRIQSEIKRIDNLEEMYSQCVHDSGKTIISTYSATLPPPVLHKPEKANIPQQKAKNVCGMEWNTDRPGSDFRSFPLSKDDPNICRNACMNEPRCKAWTYVRSNIQGPRPMCWLKNAVPQPVENQNCLSGVKPISIKMLPVKVLNLKFKNLNSK